MKEFRESLLQYGSCFLVFIIPLLFWTHRAFPYISSKTFFFYGVVEILTGLWIYSMITDRSYRLPKKVWLFFTPLFAFVGWMTIAGIVGINPSLSLWSSLLRGTGLLTWYHALAFALILASLIRRHGMEYLYTFFQWMVFGAGILGISIWLGSEGLNLPAHVFKDSGGGGFMGNSSFAAAYLVFSVFFGILLLITEHVSRKRKWWIGLTLVIILFSPVFINLLGIFNGRGTTGSARGALLGIVVGVGFAGLAYLTLSQKRIWKWLGIMGIISGIVVFAIGWHQLMAPDTTLHKKFIQTASETRFIFWDASKKAMQERPWFGFGPENYMIVFQQHFNPKMLLKENNFEGWTDRAHNIYYDTGATGGYPATALYVIFIGSIFFGLYRAVRQNRINRAHGALLGGLLVGYIAQNLLIFDSTLSWMALFAVAGIVYSLQEEIVILKKKDTEVWLNPSVKNGIAFFLLVITIVAWVFFAYRPSRKAVAYQRVFAMTTNKNYQELLKGSTIGQQWDVGGFAHDTYKLFVRNIVTIKNNKEALPYVVDDLGRFLVYLETVAAKNPNDFRLYMAIIHLYSTRIFLSDHADPGLPEHMLALLDHAKQLAPTNPEVYWGIAQIKAWQGDIQGVTQAYQDAVAIAPYLPASHQQLTAFLKGIGRQEEYREALSKAHQYIPGFIEDENKIKPE